MGFNSIATWTDFLDCLLNDRNGLKLNRLAYHFENEVKTARFIHGSSEIRKHLQAWIDNLPYRATCDERTSEVIRNQGNVAFRDPKSVHYAAGLYTKAIYIAPTGSQAIALAHANRAAAVYKLGQYEAAYYDCEYALKFGHPKVKMILMRQATCAKSLADASKLEDCIEKLEKLNLSEIDIADYKKSLNDKKASPPLAPAAEDEQLPEMKQRILKRHGHGRCVVADESISKNETIMSEEAFAFVPILDGAHGILSYIDQRSHHYICDGCAESDIVPFPCYNCRLVFYCRPLCREKQKSVHRFECNGYNVNLFAQVGIGYLALRCLLVVFNNLLEEMQQRKGLSVIQTAEQLWPMILETSRDGELMGLCTNFKVLDGKEDLIRYSITASMLCCYLTHKTSFMEETRNARQHVMQADSEWEIILTALLLRLISQMICNAHSIDHNVVTGFAGDRFLTGFLSEAAENATTFSAIYPRVSLYNHACEPSFRNKFEKAKLMVIASKAIDKGEEIFNCYGEKWIWSSRDDRRSALRQQYGFICDCAHCRDDEDTGFFKHNHIVCKADGCGTPYLPHRPCPNCGLAYDDSFYKRISNSAHMLENTIRKYKYLHELFWKMGRYLPRYTRMRSTSARIIVSTFLRCDNTLIRNNEMLTRRLMSIAVDLAEAAEEQYGYDDIEYVYASSFLLDLIAIRKQQGFEPVTIEYDVNKIKRSFNVLPIKLKKKFENYFDLNIT